MDGIKKIGKNIYFYTAVTDESTLELISIMEEALETDEELILHINSDGGVCQDGFILYNYIKKYKNPVWGIVEGRCYSAAFNILLGCDIREVTEHSLVMTHQISYGIEGAQDHSKIKALTSEGDKIAAQALDIFKKEVKVKHPKEFIREEIYLTPAQCKDLKITGITKRFQKKVDKKNK